MRYLLFAVLGIFAIGLFAVPGAFADVTVYNASGSSTPGCEETNTCFLPSIAEIGVGETVTWENTDNAAHTATSKNGPPGTENAPSGVFDSSLMMVNASFSHTFDEVGTVYYYCMVHPWMQGSVIVSEESTSAQNQPISVSTDKTTYLLDDTVQVSGTPAYNDQDVIVILKSSNGTIVSVSSLSSTSGSFNWSISVVSLNLGSYTITAKQGSSAIVETTFTVVENPNTIYNAAGSATPGCEETNSCFIPDTMTVNVGETVTWYNSDNAAHTSTGGSPSDGPSGVFDSSLIMAGGSFSHTFDTAGTYDYFCMVHSWMQGTVVVGDGGASAPVLDTVPPQVLVPDDIVIETDNQNGATASFNPQAIDNIDELLTPSCNYSSGSVFPIGTTEVTCTATDSAGNTSSNSFNVTIEFSGILIPDWIKNVAGFWHAGDINDASFLEAIAYLIEHNIIVVPSTEAGSGGGAVPEWVKNNAGWWADGQIDDETFVNAIQYLIQEGILQV